MGTGETRKYGKAEVNRAAEILGAEIVATFDWGDLKLADSYDKRLELAGRHPATPTRKLSCIPTRT